MKKLLYHSYEWNINTHDTKDILDKNQIVERGKIKKEKLDINIGSNRDKQLDRERYLDKETDRRAGMLLQTEKERDRDVRQKQREMETKWKTERKTERQIQRVFEK